MKNVCLVFFALLSNFVMGQKPLKIAEFQSKYANEEGVMAEEYDNIRIDVTESGELNIVNQHQHRSIFFTDAARLYADDYLYYSSFSTLENIDAKIFDAKGKSYSAAQILVQDRQDGGIFFDDSKVKHVVYPHIEAPCQTRISYQETSHDPHFLTKLFFSNYLPTASRCISFDVPESMQMRFKLINANSNIKEQVVRKKGRIIYSWTYENVPKYSLSDQTFNISYYEPHLLPFLVSYRYRGQVITVVDSLSDLYRWCYSHIAAIDTLKSDGDVCRLTDSLVKNMKTPLDRMNAIYYWVQQNIKYVAIEDGYSGVIPRKPHEVLHRRYGDCKDMSALLFASLRCAGIDARISWIGTRDIPYRYNDVPSSSSDNHMIVVAKVDGTYYFLDGTAVFLPSNLPSDFIQTKEALRSIDSVHFEVVDVPMVEQSRSVSYDSSYITLNGDSLFARAIYRAEGYRKFDYAVSLIRSDESKQQEILKKSLLKGNNKCDISSVKIKQIAPRESPLVVQYEYVLPDFARKVGSDLYVNLQLNKFQQVTEKIDTLKCKYGKMIDYKQERHFVARLKLPDGYIIKSLPPATKFKMNDFSFTAEYRFDAASNTLYLDDCFCLNTLAVLKHQFVDWNLCIDQINRAYSQVVVLSKK